MADGFITTGRSFGFSNSFGTAVSTGPSACHDKPVGWRGGPGGPSLVTCGGDPGGGPGGRLDSQWGTNRSRKIAILSIKVSSSFGES